MSIEVLREILIFAPPFSILGSLFILVWVGLLGRRELRGVLSLVLVQAIADIGFSSKFLMTGIWGYPNHFKLGDPTTNFCRLLGMMGQVFGQMTIGCNMMISVRTFLVFYDSHRYSKLSTVPFHVVVQVWTWSTGTFLALAEQIGPTVDGCWIKGAKNPYRFWFFDLPTTISFIGSIIILIYVLRKLRKVSRTTPGATMMEKRMIFQRQMICYIICLIIFWSIPASMRIVELFAGEFDPWPVLYADVIMLSIQGFANALVWILSNRRCGRDASGYTQLE